MDSLLSGIEPKGKDEYIGWFNLDLRELFSYTWEMNIEYFFKLDSVLMIASKGGFDINILNKMGVRTKRAYYLMLKSLIEESNKTDDESSKLGNTISEETPNNFYFGG